MVSCVASAAPLLALASCRPLWATVLPSPAVCGWVLVFAGHCPSLVTLSAVACGLRLELLSVWSLCRLPPADCAWALVFAD
ncbi:hypothetical protein Areg01_60320 [Actinoplanes regularis]|nr:hypothetical protein Areg01_60320 [Actinoplanes regularis]